MRISDWSSDVCSSDLLPWNPMRLAQRIGRLYRYGQKEHVLAFNLQGIASADELIVSKMYERLEQVARDMAAVDDATSENLVSDIRSEERRVGKECVSTFRSRWSGLY